MGGMDPSQMQGNTKIIQVSTPVCFKVWEAWEECQEWEAWEAWVEWVEWADSQEWVEWADSQEWEKKAISTILTSNRRLRVKLPRRIKRQQRPKKHPRLKRLSENDKEMICILYLRQEESLDIVLVKSTGYK
jgi:hypothetical protein